MAVHKRLTRYFTVTCTAALTLDEVRRQVGLFQSIGAERQRSSVWIEKSRRHFRWRLPMNES
jgi:hypothetical protein